MRACNLRRLSVKRRDQSYVGTARSGAASQPRHWTEVEPSGSNRRNSGCRYLVEVDLRLAVGRRDGCGRVVARRGRTESGESPEEDGADHGGSTGGSDVTVRDRCGAGRHAPVGGVVCHVISPPHRRLPPGAQSANGIMSHRGRLRRPKVTRITVEPVEDTLRYKGTSRQGVITQKNDVKSPPSWVCSRTLSRGLDFSP